MKHGKRDATHAEVRDGWRKVVGVDSVRDSGDLGGGFGDVVLGVGGVTFILEVKSGAKAKLRENQQRLMKAWRGGPWLRVDSFLDSLVKVNQWLDDHDRLQPRPELRAKP